MPILTGSASLARCNLHFRPGALDFASEPFLAIAAGSEVRESIGFVPFEPEADYQIGDARWAFRVRVDRLSPDPTAVRERLADLIRNERETGGGPLSSNRRAELKHLAEEELLAEARPTSQIVEGVIDDRVLYLGTSSSAMIGRIQLLLRKVGVLAEPKTPWGDHGDTALESGILEVHDPFQSLHGSRFLKSLLDDQELIFEPADGYLKLATIDVRATITGRVLADLHEYLDAGCEILAAKLWGGETSFRLDALSFRLSGLRLRRASPGHWTERLDERLDQITAIFELLDRKYAESRRGRRPRSAAAGARTRASGVARAVEPDQANDSDNRDNVVPFEHPSR